MNYRANASRNIDINFSNAAIPSGSTEPNTAEAANLFLQQTLLVLVLILGDWYQTKVLYFTVYRNVTNLSCQIYLKVKNKNKILGIDNKATAIFQAFYSDVRSHNSWQEKS